MNIGPQRRKPQNTGKALLAGVLEHTHIHWEMLGIQVWIDTQSIPLGRQNMPMLRL